MVTVEGYSSMVQFIDGDYVGRVTSDKQWHSEHTEIDSMDRYLTAGISVEVDPDIISLGTKLTIPTLPAPWGNYTSTVSDTGPKIKDKHVEVFIGEE